MRYFKTHQLYCLIICVILVNSFGLFFPVIRNDDPTLYASIAKNMILNHDWINLTYHGAPWLDKPHFPFWVTAVSFSIFGINSFAYLLPGFIFSLLGGLYTYRLAKELYNNDIGLIAAIIYLSSFHILLSSIDVRAEAYLLGTIMPACFYWYKYDQVTSYRSLLLGALFTACAMMSKGIFVLLTISSGLVTLWVYRREYTNFTRIKWLFALVLSFLLILPELISLYIQFDSHSSEGVVNGIHISGLKWFFWDSQFGRFFNSGPITQIGSSSFTHYFFFIHTFLWSFLPWSIIFIVAIISWYRIDSAKRGDLENAKWYYLLGSFIPTFIIFSISRFQLDYYINILLPFAAIMCATWFFRHRVSNSGNIHKVFYFQIWFSVLLIFTVIMLSIFVFGTNHIMMIGFGGLIILIIFILFIHQDDLTKSILYPVMAISLVFIFVMLINGRLCARYDAGYQAALYLNKRDLKVVDYNVYSLSLEFHSKNHYQVVDDNLDHLKQVSVPYYALIKEKDLSSVTSVLRAHKVLVVDHINGTTVDVVFMYLLSRPLLDEALSHYLIIEVK